MPCGYPIVYPAFHFQEGNHLLEIFLCRRRVISLISNRRGCINGIRLIGTESAIAFGTNLLREKIISN